MSKDNIATESTEHFSISGTTNCIIEVTPPTTDYEVVATPETDAEYMLFLRAWADATIGAGGVTFHASDPEVIAKLDANPLLRRADPPGTITVESKHGSPRHE